jgi:hypothetical protein
VMSLYLWVFLGTTPIGSLIFGAVEQTWGSRVAMLLGGGCALVAALGGGIWWRRRTGSKRSYSAGSLPSEPTAAPTA